MGDPKSLSLVSECSTFFGNTRCLSNFRELVGARWPRRRVGHYSVAWVYIKFLHSEGNWIQHEKTSGLGEFDVAMRGTLITNTFFVHFERHIIIFSTRY